MDDGEGVEGEWVEGEGHGVGVETLGGTLDSAVREIAFLSRGLEACVSLRKGKMGCIDVSMNWYGR